MKKDKLVIEIYEVIGEGVSGKITCKTYEIPNVVVRILVSEGMVWGFDVDDNQYPAILIDTDDSVIIMA